MSETLKTIVRDRLLLDNGNIIKQLNFNELDDFVSIILSSIIRKHGIKSMKESYFSFDQNEIINTMLTHLIEVGGLHIYINNFQKLSQFKVKDVACAISTSMNVSIAINLQMKNIQRFANIQYYNTDSLKIISDRLKSSIEFGLLGGEENFNYFATEMTKKHLLNNL